MKENKTILGITSNGIAVYDATCIKGHCHPGVVPIIAEVIGKLTVEGGFVRTTVDMGRIIGLDHCVKTDATDKIVYFKRKDRKEASRMVVTKEATQTPLVTIIIGKVTEGPFVEDHVLFTAFEGELAPKEPWDPSLTPEEKEESISFWETHALVPTDEEREAVMKAAKEA